MNSIIGWGPGASSGARSVKLNSSLGFGKELRCGIWGSFGLSPILEVKPSVSLWSEWSVSQRMRSGS